MPPLHQGSITPGERFPRLGGHTFHPELWGSPEGKAMGTKERGPDESRPGGAGRKPARGSSA